VGRLHDGSLAKIMMSHGLFWSGAELGATPGSDRIYLQVLDFLSPL
jgi:hypothetical protein